MPRHSPTMDVVDESGYQPVLSEDAVRATKKYGPYGTAVEKRTSGWTAEPFEGNHSSADTQFWDTQAERELTRTEVTNSGRGSSGPGYNHRPVPMRLRFEGLGWLGSPAGLAASKMYGSISTIFGSGSCARSSRRNNLRGISEHP